MTTGTRRVAGSSRIARHTSNPDMPGIATSSSTRSNAPARIAASADPAALGLEQIMTIREEEDYKIMEQLEYVDGRLSAKKKEK
jgi:hypothetical protein